MRAVCVPPGPATESHTYAPSSPGLGPGRNCNNIAKMMRNKGVKERGKGRKRGGGWGDRRGGNGKRRGKRGGRPYQG